MVYSFSTCFFFFSFFFFSSRRRHTRSLRDWSSDVCSSDLFFGCAAGHWRHEKVIVSAGGFDFADVAGEGHLLAVRRKGVEVAAAQLEGWHIVVARGEVAGHAAAGGDHKQVAALTSGVAGPVAIEEAGEDRRFHLGAGLLFRTRLVAGVILAVGVDGGDEQNILPVGRPEFAVSFGGNGGDAAGFARQIAGGAVEIHHPDLRAAALGGDVSELLAIGGPARPVLAGNARG